MNSLVADEAEVFGGKNEKFCSFAQILRRIKDQFQYFEVLFCETFWKAIVMVLKPKAMALTPSIPGQIVTLIWIM